MGERGRGWCRAQAASYIASRAPAARNGGGGVAEAATRNRRALRADGRSRGFAASAMGAVEEKSARSMHVQAESWLASGFCGYTAGRRQQASSWECCQHRNASPNHPDMGAGAGSMAGVAGASALLEPAPGSAGCRAKPDSHYACGPLQLCSQRPRRPCLQTCERSTPRLNLGCGCMPSFLLPPLPSNR